MGTAYSAADIFEDPHMAARGDIIAVQDPVMDLRQQAPFPRFVGEPIPVPTGAPRSAPTTDAVWCDLVGLSEADLEDLAAGAFARGRPGVVY